MSLNTEPVRGRDSKFGFVQQRGKDCDCLVNFGTGALVLIIRLRLKAAVQTFGIKLS